MPRMYHPNLGVEAPVPDDDGCIAVLAESGWKIAPEPEPVSVGLVPEPVTYEPVTAKPETKPKPKPKPTETDGD
jgi:hypothetical protein